jgi:ubiquinone/menaquinone biosynthesis C-methylase UbiE
MLLSGCSHHRNRETSMPTISLEINVEETRYEAPTEWRMLGGRGKADHIIKLCQQHNIKVTRLLEVGAGDGAILKCLSERRFCGEMHALEISESGVDTILGQKIPGLISCQKFDGYNLPFEDNHFDLIVLSHVLEHVEYERALLRELRRVSRHQVIEIPMDCNALNDEVYHLLGPSYGHINAHTPDSLRFLLSMEGFAIVGELLGQYSLELQEYDYFINNNRERTAAAVKDFRSRYGELEAQFDALPRSAQVARSSFYAVLTRREDEAARLMRAMTGAKKSIASGQVQAARLIFDHYVPKALIVDCAVEIADFARDSNPHLAIEFLDKALAMNSTHGATVSLKKQILQDINNRPSRMPAEPSSPERKSTLRRAKDFIKRRHPRLASVLRKIRSQGAN